MKRVLVLFFVVFALAAGSEAWGRAGGGHSYSGSSSSSRSSSSSSSSSRSSSSSSRSSFGSSSSRSSSSSPSRSSSASSPSRGSGTHYSSSSSSTPYTGGFPWALVFGFAVFGGVAWVGFKAWTNSVDQQRTSQAFNERWRDTQDAGRAGRPDAVAPGLAALRERDPSFDVDQFLQRARRDFVAVQHAWSSGDFAPVERLLSDGVLRRFRTQVTLDRFHGRRNVTTAVRVDDADSAAVASDGTYDTFHVCFEASARDCDVEADLPDVEAYALASRAPVNSFVEYWSFVRKQDASERGKHPSGACPSCGAPQPRQPLAVCDHCQAVLNSGTYDWVLSEITQESEWGRQIPTVAGLAEAQAVDPNLHPQVLEDRASLVFWKWLEARTTGSVAPFGRLCAPGALEGVAASAKTESLERAAVGSVDLLSIRDGAERQSAFFDVRWSTAGAGSGIVRRHVLELSRETGLKTNAKAGFSTDRCHLCNAPQVDQEAVECAFCSAQLPQDWSFQALHATETYRSLARGGSRAAPLGDTLGTLVDPYERLRTLTVMVAMARANGAIAESERNLLRQCAKRWSIDTGRLTALLNAPLQDLAQVTPRSQDEAHGFFRALLVAALIDGRVDREERLLLQKTALHLGVEPEMAARLEAEVKAQRAA